MASFKSRLSSIHDKEKANLARVKELEEALVMEKEMTSFLEGKLSIAYANLNIEKGAQIQAKELSDAGKL